MNSSKHANFMPTLCQLMHAVSGIEGSITLAKNNLFKKSVDTTFLSSIKTSTKNNPFKKSVDGKPFFRKESFIKETISEA